MPDLKPGMQLVFDGDDRWSVRHGDEVLARYAFRDLRFSVSWKAYCFADAAEEALVREHRDDLSRAAGPRGAGRGSAPPRPHRRRRAAGRGSRAPDHPRVHPVPAAGPRAGSRRPRDRLGPTVGLARRANRATTGLPPRRGRASDARRPARRARPGDERRAIAARSRSGSRSRARRAGCACTPSTCASFARASRRAAPAQSARCTAQPSVGMLELALAKPIPAGPATLRLAFSGRLRRDLCGLYAARSGTHRSPSRSSKRPTRASSSPASTSRR